MKKSEQKRFDELYLKHLLALKLQGMSDRTIEAYTRAVRRISAWFDCCPDRLEPEQLARCFTELVESHSWPTVKLDRCSLQFFYKHVLGRDWQWVEMIRAPKIRSLPVILRVAEIERLIGAARKLRYRIFMLTTYSMGLRLGVFLSEISGLTLLISAEIAAAFQVSSYIRSERSSWQRQYHASDDQGLT